MLKLKTKTEFEFPTGRGTKTGIIHMIVDSLFMDNNNVVPNGYYYYFDENETPIKIDDIKHMELWENIALAESQLPPLSENSLKANTLQRLSEFTFLQLQAEAGKNFGTVASDWEVEN